MVELKFLTFLIICCVLIISCKLPQQINTKNQYAINYKNQLEPDSKLIKAWYHYTMEELPNGDFVYKQYYPDTRQMTHFITYSDKFQTKNGKFIEWYDNGQKWREGQHINGKAEGIWKEFRHSDGMLSSKGHLLNNVKEGEWTDYDTLGNISAAYFYKEGKRDGSFKILNPNGTIKSNGLYEQGELIVEKNTINEVINESLKEEMPHLAACTNENKEMQWECNNKLMLESIYNNVKYPVIARKNGIEGKALLRFVIEEDGSLSDIVVLRGLCKEIEATCIETVNNLPPWTPGYQKGEAVRVQFNLPIKFQLD